MHLTHMHFDLSEARHPAFVRPVAKGCLPVSVTYLHMHLYSVLQASLTLRHYRVPMRGHKHAEPDT